MKHLSSHGWYLCMLVLMSHLACTQSDEMLQGQPSDVFVTLDADSNDVTKRQEDAVLTDGSESLLSGIEAFKSLASGADSIGLNNFFSTHSEPVCNADECLILYRQDAQSTVWVRGSFDGWSEAGVELMSAVADPTIRFALVNGNFQSVLSYRFLVDGVYTMDPRNPYVVHTNQGMASALYKGGVSRLAWQPDVECKALNNRRSIWIYLPRMYFEKPERRFPVLYLQDGQNVLHQPETNSWDVDLTADELIDSGRVEPLIIVAVESKNRLSEYVHAPVTIFEKKRDALLSDYTDCLIGVIMPLINQNFRTKTTREYVGIAGASLGGSSSFHIAWRYSGYFSKAASFSGSFWIGEQGTMDWHQPSIREIIVANDEANTPADLKLYLDSGDHNDGKASYEADGWATTDWTRNTLIASGWDNRVEWDTDNKLTTAPVNLPISTPHNEVPCLEWSAGLPEQYSTWSDYLKPQNNLLSLVGKGHQHNGLAWRARFGAMLSFLYPANP